jgi:hypothetical protein
VVDRDFSLYNEILALSVNERRREFILLTVFLSNFVARRYIYGPNDRGVGVRAPVGPRIFISPTLGSTPIPVQWITGVLAVGVKLLGHEFDHSPPISAEIKKTWIYTSIPPYVFMA